MYIKNIIKDVNNIIQIKNYMIQIHVINKD